jgi:hypothetical protein
MSEIKQIKDKRFHLVWDSVTKEIVVDYESNNPQTVTYFAKDGLVGEGFDGKAEKDKKIEDEKLKEVD